MFDLHLPTLTLACISIFWLLTVAVLLIGWQFNQHRDIKLWGVACLLISAGTSIYNLGNSTEISGLVWLGATAAMSAQVFIWWGTQSLEKQPLWWRVGGLLFTLVVGIYSLLLVNDAPLAIRISFYCVFYAVMHLMVLRILLKSHYRARTGYRLYTSIVSILLILYGLRIQFAFDTPFNETTLSHRYIFIYYMILMAEFVKFVTFIYLCFERLEYTLCQLALQDTLTQLPNRRAFVTQTTQRLEDDTAHALLLADLDNFKSINDVYGHLAGDQVLIAFSQHLQHIAQQEGALCARTGGEEFILLLNGDSVKRVQQIALQLRRQIEACQVRTEQGHIIRFTVSIGVAIHRRHQPLTINQLFECADGALYEAKARGRNRIEFALTEHHAAPSSVAPMRVTAPTPCEESNTDLPKRYLTRQSLT
ncbi:hypothetical protein BZJ19_16415 [Salinivibrio proteolyticus]|uniref:GGDEF domain-containing protein n=1 Tax=Salinivibrio proteolyticus TaxID=334715 RepID=UPI0009889BB9|nr:GGDEF domain-containing protein [Salinivibrio proteolyticus]OOF21365.1 hypothetical protein BZJ19_16415 [Salinivibrio proteolyticus]